MRKLKPYFLLAPYLILGAVFLIGVLNAFVQSVGYVPALGLNEITLKYYKELFQKSYMLDSIKLSLFIAFTSTFFAGFFGILISWIFVMLSETNLLFKKITFSIIRIPLLIPHTVVALFVVMLISQNGLIARILFQLGLLENKESFPMLLYTNNTGIILAYLWKEIPFVAYFIYSLMSSISHTLGEAANNLGCSKVRSFFYVTLPLSMPVITKALLIIFAFSFGAYELPFLLGGTLPKALPVQAYIEYTATDLAHRPYAMAMNGIILIIALILLLIYWLCIKVQKNRGIS